MTDLLAKLAEFNIGALVVSSDGATVSGIVSERDVVRQLAASGADALTMPVSQIATPTVTQPTIGHHRRSDGAHDGVWVRHVPVLDDEEHMIGIVSIGDVVKEPVGRTRRRTQRAGRVRQRRSLSCRIRTCMPPWGRNVTDAFVLGNGSAGSPPEVIGQLSQNSGHLP